jgi:hypothetical protein
MVEYTYEVVSPYAAVINSKCPRRVQLVADLRDRLRCFTSGYTRDEQWIRIMMNDFESPTTLIFKTPFLGKTSQPP